MALSLGGRLCGYGMAPPRGPGASHIGNYVNHNRAMVSSFWEAGHVEPSRGWVFSDYSNMILKADILFHTEF